MRASSDEVAALFQSTSPVRGTTEGLSAVRHGQRISIHVPREGDDRSALPVQPPPVNFNPRPP